MQLIAASRPELATNGGQAEQDSPDGIAGLAAPGLLARRPLPIPPTRLVGRDEELEHLELFARADVRLLNLTGEGGVGKTRLALAFAERIAPEFADGVAFVDLALVPSPQEVAPAIARATGVNAGAARTPIETLCASLRDQQLLLILDSFEHLIAAAGVVAELLGCCAGLKVIVTSQERLNLRGEHVVPVNPLQVPTSPDDWPAGRRLLSIPATQLFERAREVNFGFDLIKEDPRTIVGVCRKLEGLPLAIELAAARTRTLPISVLLHRLDNPPPELGSGPRDLPERQQTLRTRSSGARSC